METDPTPKTGHEQGDAPSRFPATDCSPVKIKPWQAVVVLNTLAASQMEIAELLKGPRDAPLQFSHEYVAAALEMGASLIEANVQGQATGVDE